MDDNQEPAGSADAGVPRAWATEEALLVELMNRRDLAALDHPSRWGRLSFRDADLSAREVASGER